MTTDARTLRLTLVQEAPLAGDIPANAERVRRRLLDCPADLLVFPELFLTGYTTVGVEALALPADAPLIASLAEACRASSTALLLGYVERAGSEVFDSYLAIDRDGDVREPVRKSHLFGAEQQAFDAGKAIEPVTLSGVRIGVINCFELEFPEVARTLALRGAEIFVAGSANMHPYTADHAIASQARAIENRMPIAYANLVGEADGLVFCGSSRFVDSDGNVLAQLDEHESGTISHEYSIVPRRSDFHDMIGQRRPELYER